MVFSLSHNFLWKDSPYPNGSLLIALYHPKGQLGTLPWPFICSNLSLCSLHVGWGLGRLVSGFSQTQ